MGKINPNPEVLSLNNSSLTSAWNSWKDKKLFRYRCFNIANYLACLYWELLVVSESLVKCSIFLPQEGHVDIPSSIALSLKKVKEVSSDSG